MTDDRMWFIIHQIGVAFLGLSLVLSIVASSFTY
jgi:hypothetical protein